MTDKQKEDLRLEIPSYAWISLARRGMEKISLDQCFLKNCDNQDVKLLEPFEMKEYDEENKHIKIISVKCKKCGGIFKFKLETLKKVAKPTKKGKEEEDDEGSLSMGLAYALDENDNNLGHIGYF
jgi:hypothetical protein